MMATTLRSLTRPLSNSIASSSRHRLTRNASRSALTVPRRDWRTGSHPAPLSILDDDSQPVDLSEDNEAVNGARPNTPPLHRRSPPLRSTPAEYLVHRQAMKKAFPEGWAPARKLSREAMDGLRQLHHIDPDTFSTSVLSQRFRISPEAVRRILKSKWEPTREQRAKWAEKERVRRGNFITLSRVQERLQAMELESYAAEVAPRSRRRGREEHHCAGRVRGVNSKDKLTFQ